MKEILFILVMFVLIGAVSVAAPIVGFIVGTGLGLMILWTILRA